MIFKVLRVKKYIIIVLILFKFSPFVFIFPQSFFFVTPIVILSSFRFFQGAFFPLFFRILYLVLLAFLSLFTHFLLYLLSFVIFCIQPLFVSYIIYLLRLLYFVNCIVCKAFLFLLFLFTIISNFRISFLLVGGRHLLFNYCRFCNVICNHLNANCWYFKFS
jgi:hypothetical protein